MRGAKYFAAGFALLGALANASVGFASGIHVYDEDDEKTYGEAVIEAVRNTFKEELTNTQSAVLHDSTGDKELNVTLRPVYGVTNASDIVGVYYYDDNVDLEGKPLDESNADIVASEAILKIVEHRLFDADETNTTDDNQSSIFVIDSFLDSQDATREVYSFMDAYRNYRTAFSSDNEEVSVKTKTFKVTIPAHKKWGFYLTNGSHTYYTDENFNLLSDDYPDRRYNQTADIVVNGKSYTIFGMEDWLATSNPGSVEECERLAHDTERDPYQVVFNCMDANDIVFIIDDDYEEPEEPEEPEEENPNTGETVITPMSFALFALAGFGLVGIRVIRNRNQ